MKASGTAAATGGLLRIPPHERHFGTAAAGAIDIPFGRGERLIRIQPDIGGPHGGDQIVQRGKIGRLQKAERDAQLDIGRILQKLRVRDPLTAGKNAVRTAALVFDTDGIARTQRPARL